MYTVDERATVVKLSEAPQCSVGAPLPMILLGEHFLHLAYLLQETPEGWDFTTIRVVSETTPGKLCALVRFTRVYAHMFGPPNDEALQGHPLAKRGLRPYSVFEVKESSWIRTLWIRTLWIRTLERMNSVHPYHKPETLGALRHFIFAFHDRTFECIARGFEVSVGRGSVTEVLP